MLKNLTNLFRSSKPAPAVPEQRALNLVDWPSVLLEGAQTAANISVNPTSAMSCPPVRAAVGLISGTLATLPLSMYSTTSGQRRGVQGHPLIPLLRFANPWTPFSTIVEQVSVDALLTGSGYVFVNRVAGVPRELLRVNPTSVSVSQDDARQEPTYKIGVQSISHQDLIHIRAPGSISIAGDSPTIQGREAIGLVIAMQRHASRLFGNSARPGGIISFPKDLTATQIENARTYWQASNSGENSGKTSILVDGAEWQQMQLTSVDAQFNELWERAVGDIAKSFNVPPPLIHELGRATWSNTSVLVEAFLKFGLSRWLDVWTGELALKLLNDQERRELEFVFDSDLLLRMNLQQRAEAYSKLISSRIITPNEARGWEDLPPIAGGDELSNPAIEPVKSISPSEPKGGSDV